MNRIELCITTVMRERDSLSIEWSLNELAGHIAISGNGIASIENTRDSESLSQNEIVSAAENLMGSGKVLDKNSSRKR